MKLSYSIVYICLIMYLIFVVGGGGGGGGGLLFSQVWKVDLHKFLKLFHGYQL